MKAYKGFDKDLKCRGFQYEIGKTYTMMEGEPVKLCKRGFHACEKPLDCFGYYAPGLSRYCEVELADVSGERSGDSKRVAKTITIIRELTKDEMHDISQEGAENGGDGSSLRGGDGSSLRGGNGSSLRGGNRSSLRGGNGSSLNGGNRSSLNGGDWSSLNGGNESSLNGGDWSSLNGGDWSSLNGGDESSLNGGNGSSLRGGNWSSLRGGNGSSLRGGNGSSLRGGNRSRFCGKKNTVFAAEWRINNVFIGMRVAVVDGVNIKEDVWYDLDDNGEWKEADNQQDI